MGPSGRRFRTSLMAAIAAVMVIAGCSDNSSPSVEKLPTSPGVVTDSIEDLNSTKDMTGVVTKYNSNENPYLKLIPYVCPFLPDSVTKKLGMATKSNGFNGQHTLLQTCDFDSGTDQSGASIGMTVRLQALPLTEVLGGASRRILSRDIEVGGGVKATTYKVNGDDNQSTSVCGAVWGTFYGTAVVTVTAFDGYPADTCQKSVEFAQIVRPFLPSHPAQMRAR